MSIIFDNRFRDIDITNFILTISIDLFLTDTSIVTTDSFQN